MSSSSPQNSGEPRGLIYILISTFAFLCGLLFSKSGTPIQESIKGIHANNPADKANKQDKYCDHEHTHRITIESYPPPTITNKEKTSKKREIFRKWGIFVIELFGLLGLLYYAQTTKKMWQEMHKQTGVLQAQSQMIIAGNERPWVFVKPPRSIDIGVGRPITAAVEVFNYGRNSAAMVRASIHIEAGPNVIESFRAKLRPPLM